MTTVLAPHHVDRRHGYISDRYGNDPFVWTAPFLWSHCHARSRSPSFGFALSGTRVHGKDAVFFVGNDPESNEPFIDCVFLVAEVVAIGLAESRFSQSDPARHYHFDQARSPHHEKSKLTRVADPIYSFVPHPPMPLGLWIENHVEQRSMSVIDYFRLRKRRNVRMVTVDAQGLYERVVQWSKINGRSALSRLPAESLKGVRLDYPAVGEIAWPDEREA